MSLNNKDIINIISQILEIDEKNINLGDRLVEDLGADSIDIMSMIVYISEEFDIEVDDENVHITTVEDIIKLINERSYKKC